MCHVVELFSVFLGCSQVYAKPFADQGKYDEAVPHAKRSIKILTKALGVDHPSVAIVINNLATLFRGRVLVQRCVRRAVEVLMSVFLTCVCIPAAEQGKYDEAEPLFKRSLEIDEKVYGPDHPDVARGLNNLGALLAGTFINVVLFSNEDGCVVGML